MADILVIRASIPIQHKDVYNEILLTVYEMLRFSSRKRKLKSEHCEGVITTEFVHKTFVGSSGIECHATIDMPNGESTVHFLVSETAMRDLETAPEYGLEDVKTRVKLRDDEPNPVYEHYRRN